MKYIKLIIEFIIETLKLAALSLPTIGYYTCCYISHLQATSIMNIFEKWEYNEYTMYLCDRINSWYDGFDWEHFCSVNVFSITINGIIVTIITYLLFGWIWEVIKYFIVENKKEKEKMKNTLEKMEDILKFLKHMKKLK